MAVLLVEDNALDARRIEKILAEGPGGGFSVHRAPTLRDGIEALKRGRYDVTLLDLVLPDSHDLRTLRRIQAHDDRTPIVVLSNREDAEMAATAVQEGAQDFLMKAHVHPEVLRRSVRYAVERQALRDRLRRSERQFRRSLELAPDPIWILDGAGRVRYVNDQLARVLDFPAADILGRPWAEFLTQAEAERFERLSAETRRASSGHVMVRVRRRDGVDVPLELHAVDLANGDLQIIGRDMTDWLLTQEALRASQQRLSRILESAMDAIITIDEERHIVLFNDAAARTFRCTETEALGQSIDRFLPEAARDEFRALLGADAGRATLAAQRSDGELFPIEATVSRVEVGGKQLFTAIIRDLSERVRANEALRESEQFAQSTLDALADSIAILDEDGAVIAVNAAWHQGRAALPLREAESGGGASLLAACETATGDNAPYLHGIARGIRDVRERAENRVAVEYPWRQAEHVEWYKTVITRFHAAGPARVVLATHGIGERKRAEEALRRSEERYRLLLDGAPDAIWLVDHSLRYLYVNDAACELLRRSREDLLGRHLAEMRPPDELTNLNDGFRRVREQGTADVRTRLQRGDGSLVSVEIHAVDLGNGQYESVVRDITPWMDDESARQASQERYLQALDRATEGIWFLDRRGICTYINDSACSILLREREQVVGHPLAEFAPEEELPAIRAALQRVHEEGEAICQIRLRRGDGSTVTVEVEGVALENGSCQAFVRSAVA